MPEEIKIKGPEKELLLRITEGDQEAFGILFNNYRDKIYSIALELTHSQVTAEEVVQDVFVIIWKRRSSLLSIKHFTAYLFTIVRNEVYVTMKRVMHFQKEDALVARDAVLLKNEVEDKVLNNEYERILQSAIYRLPPQQQQVYLLIRENGLKRGEVAVIMQLTPETVKSYLAKAMRSVRIYCLTMIKLAVLIWMSA